MFSQLSAALARPEPFSITTTRDLWDDPHISRQMLRYHLDPDLDVSSRNHDFVARSLSWIGERFRVGPGTRVLDLGCGPGLYALPLAQRGAEVTGVDLSANSIAYARAQAPRDLPGLRYQVGDYLQDELPGDQDLVLLDGYLLAAYEAREEGATLARDLMDGFWSPRPYVGLRSTWRYPAERVVLDRYWIVEEEGARDFFNWLQYYDRETLGRELEEAGFEVEAWFGDVAGSPPALEDLEVAALARVAGSSASGQGPPRSPGPAG